MLKQKSWGGMRIQPKLISPRTALFKLPLARL
jgi:hypothetical protein